MTTLNVADKEKSDPVYCPIRSYGDRKIPFMQIQMLKAAANKYTSL